MTAARTPGPGAFREGALELPGRTIHYVECGAGRPVVLLHGFTDSWHSFRLVLPSLSALGRCVVPDQRGHGRSAYDGDNFTLGAFTADAAALIDRLGLGPVALVGHSMGSFVARKVALARPDLVDRLVLVGSALRADNAVVRQLVADVAGFEESAPRAFVEEFQAGCVSDRGSVPDGFFAACVDASAGVSPRVWRAAMAGLLADDDADRLGGVECPALVVGGREDAVFGPDEQAELARALPGGRLLLYEGVGHSPNWECPGRFAADVAAFLSEPV